MTVYETFDGFGTRAYEREDHTRSLGLYLRLLCTLRIATQGPGIGEWMQRKMAFFNLLWKEG